MDNAKTLRAAELLNALRTAGWTNPEFWEAKHLLDSTGNPDMDDTMVGLLFAWGDVESDRISCGEHDAPPPGLMESLASVWPIARPTHSARGAA